MRFRPGEDDGFAFATPFSVEGRSAKEVIAEFGGNLGWSPAPGSEHRLRLQAIVSPSRDWVDVVCFRWWAPSSEEAMRAFLAHRNPPDAVAAGAQTV